MIRDVKLDSVVSKMEPTAAMRKGAFQIYKTSPTRPKKVLRADSDKAIPGVVL